MSYIKKLIILVSTIIILIVGLNIFIDYGRKTNNDFYNKVKKILPQNFKNFLAKNIFFISHITKLEQELVDKDILIRSVKKQLKNNEIGYNYIKENGLEFVEFDKKNLISKYKKEKYEFVSFRNIFLLDNGKRAYLEIFQDNIFIISGNGLLNFISINDLELDNKTIFFNNINTNLNQFIGVVTTDTENDGHKNTSDVMGIKGMKIIDENIFISYVKEISKDCYTTAVLKAPINLSNLVFKEFFSPKQCVERYQETGRFYPYLTGGAMHSYKDKKILLSIGEYGYLKNSQDLESLFGKIVAIDQNGLHKIISYGHRNPQGLTYNFIDDVIVSSEHGPSGGDEININVNPEKLVKNFGWPISSYGKHDGKNQGFKDPIKYHRDENLYEYAPLHKSHKYYGFIEPIKYYVPSIGPAQIIELNKNFINNGLKNYMLASMGGSVEDGDMSLHLLSLNKEYNQIIEFDIIHIHDRIRSLIYLEKNNQLMFFTENNSLIGFLRKIEK